jgi:hypothetical protein
MPQVPVIGTANASRIEASEAITGTQYRTVPQL